MANCLFVLLPKKLIGKVDNTTLSDRFSCAARYMRFRAGPDGEMPIIQACLFALLAESAHNENCHAVFIFAWPFLTI